MFSRQPVLGHEPININSTHRNRRIIRPFYQTTGSQFFDGKLIRPRLADRNAVQFRLVNRPSIACKTILGLMNARPVGAHQHRSHLRLKTISSFIQPLPVGRIFRKPLKDHSIDRGRFGLVIQDSIRQRNAVSARDLTLRIVDRGTDNLDAGNPQLLVCLPILQSARSRGDYRQRNNQRHQRSPTKKAPSRNLTRSLPLALQADKGQSRQEQRGH